MKNSFLSSAVFALAVCGTLCLTPSSANAQDPILTPVIIDTAAPIVISAVTPKPKPGVHKFQGYFVNGTSAQVTLKAKDNELALQTFPLSQEASEKMQKVIDKGGYQYGDKVTVYFNSTTHQALKFKGKPSRPL